MTLAGTILVGAVLFMPGSLPAGAVLSEMQLAQRPYDAGAARDAAAKIRQLIEERQQGRGPGGDESDLGELMQFLAESIRSVRDLRVVDDDVLDAIVALAGNGRLATDTILRFGDRSVAPLVQWIRSSALRSNRAGAIDTLQDMLTDPEIQRTLSSDSRGAIHALAQEVMGNASLSFVELASAACLAIATGDAELRAAAVRLTDRGELTARGVNPDRQSFVVSRIRTALDRAQIR